MIDETRHCILKAFTELLREKLYTEIRMTEIAEKAHVSRRTLYRYFDGKERILDAALTDQMTFLMNEIGQREEWKLHEMLYAHYAAFPGKKDEFIVLKKTGLLEYVGEKLPVIVMRMIEKLYEAGDTEAVPFSQPTAEERYRFHYTVAGCGRMSKLWLEEGTALSAEEMTGITVKMLEREYGECMKAGR